MNAIPVKPQITIVTVCYNAGATIAQSLNSVKMQTFDHYEHLIVDGASRDNTKELIQGIDNPRLRLISEPDKGIYDAMNKGITQAQGEWICFLNADDFFDDSNVLSELVQKMADNPSALMIYGKARVIDEDSGGRLIRGRVVSLRDYYWVAPIVHQTVFFHKSLFQKIGFYDLSILGGAADWEWFVRFFASPYSSNAHFWDRIIVTFRSGGASFGFAWMNFQARKKTAKTYFPLYVWAVYVCKSPIVWLKFKLVKLMERTFIRRFYRKLKFRLTSD